MRHYLAMAALVLFAHAGPTFAQTKDEDVSEQKARFVPIILIRAEASKVALRLRVALGSEALVVAHPKTNSVFVSADAKATQRAKDLAKTLDVEVSLHLLRLEYADAALVEPFLNAVLKVIAFWDGDIQESFVVAEFRLNGLLVRATESRLRQVRLLVRLLEFPFAAP
jgi:type II secretory pathway component GspD/PulD (secretin)